MMKKMDYQNVRGTVDYLPKDETIRWDIRRTLEDTFMAYGCRPLETPILNYSELMSSKYGGGAEILQEMYTLSDRGERNLALRYDLTIPFAKVVAMNPTLPMPFKRYEIGKVFRDGPIKAGRFREFTQCDVDIVGVSSQIAEAELMQMALDAFDNLQLNVAIQYNNRKLLVGLLEVFEVPNNKMNRVILILDKLEKVGVPQVLKELMEIQLSSKNIQAIEAFLLAEDKNSFTYFEQYSDNANIKEGLAELSELNSYLNYLAIEDQCIFTPLLARGLEIYTGTIYEIFLVNQAITSSIGSGGRYDNAIAGLIGTTQNFSTVGISFGLDVIFAALSTKEKEEKARAVAEVYIIPLKTLKESLYLATKLREDGYKVELEMSNKKLNKAMEKANREQFPYVIVLGENEVSNNQYQLKDMLTGEYIVKEFEFH